MTTLAFDFFKIIPAHPEDIAAITTIYSYHVKTSTGTFEETPPTEAEMRQRFTDLSDGNYPYLVARHTDTAEILGYAYAGPFRHRSAYRYSVEDSIYIHQDFQRQGIASKLLSALITASTQAGYRQMFALIGGANNHGSIGLHRKAGFLDAGRMVNAGFKDGRWLDVVVMQRTLGDGARSLPSPNANAHD